MKILIERVLTFAVVASAISSTGQNASAQRPHITGIDHVSFYTTAPDGNQQLYAKVLGLSTAAPSEPGQTQRYDVGAQWIGYSPVPNPKASDRMDHLAFTTDDSFALRLYLAAQHVKVPDTIRQLPDGSTSFIVQDPEGHNIEFVERPKSQTMQKPAADAVSRRVIHAGFIVGNRNTEDRFYEDVLGFRLYWHGGMKPGDTDWVAMQVPDGTDWLEYMLNIAPHPDLQTTGEMNHISFGVRDMKVAEAKMRSHGWKPQGKEDKEIGKDGKWQLDVYDPDLSRVELMEFKPVQKPCCSDFQGSHPQEP